MQSGSSLLCSKNKWLSNCHPKRIYPTKVQNIFKSLVFSKTVVCERSPLEFMRFEPNDFCVNNGFQY